MYGNDYEYANSRLEGTVVRLKGKPVYISSVGQEMTANVSYLTSIEEIFKVTVDELDLKPVPLGYCNRRGSTSYLMRMPMRRDWRQGTRIANMRAEGAFPPDVLAYKELDPVIRGEYPTLKECLEFVGQRGGRTMAWCREWAVGSDSQLFHKSELVGSIVDGVPTLDKTNSYLSQALGEVL